MTVRTSAADLEGKKEEFGVGRVDLEEHGELGVV